ncbi:MAG: aminomethyl-transferring glycine dehydrogenase subunit GcvPB [Candidatus Marinimicrobia bacterium]|nr:aminomethyl-transferring glycine dehydrogenase subunit GcvPB [Candidatus Neomarinimicrobiota bacterium]
MAENKVIFEKSVPGRWGVILPESAAPQIKLSDNIAQELLRSSPAELPEVTEPQVVRHYVNLSVKNHHIDKDFYPLGSCTMKYNPKINDALAALPGFSTIHPLQGEENCQGALHIMFELSRMLQKITGMADCTLQPSAGSQGEFVGLLIMKKYHEQKGEDRKYIIIPETAHGTNPASVVLGGYQPLEVKSDNRGRVDMDDLRSKVNENVAGMMLTQPNTLGLFEDSIEEIASLIHDAGGLMYMDGANLNALVGLCRSADMGFDITHINLHKTFSTPHGGGGPGSGPIAVVDHLSKFLPVPRVAKQDNGQYYLQKNCPDSIGQVHSFYGNFSILVRAYVYIKMLGDEGLKKMSRQAIINANYLKHQLKDAFHIPFPEGTLHEFVVSGVKQKEKGVKVLDIAKALLDHGFHAPTIYFPNNVPEAMMIEPTESETRETLDRFVSSMLEINESINTNPESIKQCPVNTPVSRLDETKANRELNLRWKNDLS